MVDVAVVTIVKRAHTDNEVRPSAVQTQPKWSCRSSVTSPSSIRPLPPRPENDATATSSERSRMQTPAPVDYARAHSVEEALEMLERYGPESRLIAGGHSLIPMMRLRIAQPERVIDINDLTELDYIRSVATGDSHYLAIGSSGIGAPSAVRCARPILPRTCPRLRRPSAPTWSFARRADLASCRPAS